MKFNITIVGGGIVGMATAYHLKTLNPELSVLVLEKESEIAAHQTGHNSGVIHSGLYYKPQSLKALNCIKGYNLLVDFCKTHHIPFELCGKIVVATEKKELPLLENLFKRGQENGLSDLKRITQGELREYEPYVDGVAGIHVPQTGIVDYKKVCEKYADLFQELDGRIHLNESVLHIETHQNRIKVVTSKNTYESALLINCAGLYSDKIAEMTMPTLDIRIIPFRGEYYQLRKEKEYLIKNLIYPVPDPNFPFLGVHFTRMAKGGVEAGPNAVLAFRREGYKKSDFNLAEFSESIRWRGFQKVMAKYWRMGMSEMYRSYSKSAFTAALQRLVPDIKEDDLVPGGSGVRAQACDRSGKLLDDFLILEDDHTIHVCNAPSPAATSSLSIGETVAQRALKRL